MSSEKCLCCNVHQGAVVAANYFILAYGAALGVTVWWIIQSRGQVPIGAYILLAIYFLTFMLSIILVLSLAVQRRPSVLFVWMLIICIFFLPECGLNLWVCIWGLGVGTAKGLGFLVFYAARAVINIICIVCINFAYSSWKADKEASKQRIANAYASTAYQFSSAPPPSLYFWNFNPHFPLLNPYHNQQNAPVDYGIAPYSMASSLPFSAPTTAPRVGRPPRPPPLAAGVLVKHRVVGGRPKTAAETATGGESSRHEKMYGKHVGDRQASAPTPGDHRDPEADANRIPPDYRMPIPAIYVVDPWRLNYPPPPPFWATGPRAPQAFDSYTPAPLSTSALAFSGAAMPHANFYPPQPPPQPQGVGRTPSFYYSNSAPIEFQPTFFNGIAPMRNWNTATGLYELPKNPIPPGTIFDSKASDVEPSFGNFIMRQRRLGDLGTFRPKSLRGSEETKNLSEHVYRPEDRRRSKAIPRLHYQQESERPPPRLATPVYDRGRNRSHRNYRSQPAPRASADKKHAASRSPRAATSAAKPSQTRHHSRERRKTTLTTLLSSSYYRYHHASSAGANRPKGGLDSGAESSTVYGHTPVKLDETTWTLM